MCAATGHCLRSARLRRKQRGVARSSCKTGTTRDALDKTSGPHFEVFALRDIEDHKVEVDSRIESMTAASLSRSRSRGYYFSHLLKDYFGEDKTKLAYPSFLLFLAEHGRVKYCRLIPFRRASIEDMFDRLSALFSAIAIGIEDVGGPTVSSDVLWEHLKTELLKLKYTLYIQNAPTDAGQAIRQLATYVEK